MKIEIEIPQECEDAARSVYTAWRQYAHPTEQASNGAVWSFRAGLKAWIERNGGIGRLENK